MAAEQTQKHPTLPEVKEELKKIIDRGFPILAMGLATYLKNMILVMCMGRLGSLELAGGALAIGFTNITGYSVLSGLALGMEPLSSQAFGSRNLTLVSLALQRTIFMLLTASIPIAFLWFNFESLMLKLHQDSQIIHVASVFCRFAVPDLIANSFLHPLRIYLRCKENVKLLPSISVGEQWIMLLQLAIPSCLAVCLEWWWYEFMTVLAGYLDRPEVPLAASAIVIQTTSLMYTLPSALSASVSSRVGNELGAGRPAKARLATGIAIGLAFLTSTFGFILTTIGREAWGRVFTKDREVLELTATVLPIIGLCELANCPQTTCCGVLRGSARPGVGAGINFYSFYLMGTPVAIILAFVWKLGFLGLCYGLLAAQVACVISMLIVTYSTDWEGASLKAKQLVGRTNELPYEDQLVKIEEGNGFLKRFSF
ncbi:protein DETOXIFICATION 55 isoform X2 [Solanum lycopersicum]|uniref:protein DETOXIFICATION 55 isoform X2 n=1 Tax=Solanum lycopersicum TaxID=4081 RepID=UPI0008FEB0C1|nr:protein DETOXIFICATION 55 isoform X2 [Solanum lycopersicum]